jgi:chemotaxis signal transduction protein
MTDTADNGNDREGAGGAPPDNATRTLLLLRGGAHALALFAEEVEGTIPLASPAPLPHAPPAVLGIVSARGRMRTAISLHALLDAALTDPARRANAPAPDAVTHTHAVLLKGDEQLALAVSHAGTTIDVAAAEIRAAGENDNPLARAAFTHEGSEVLILDPARFFEAATRDMERRRRRR